MASHRFRVRVACGMVRAPGPGWPGRGPGGEDLLPAGARFCSPPGQSDPTLSVLNFAHQARGFGLQKTRFSGCDKGSPGGAFQCPPPTSHPARDDARDSWVHFFFPLDLPAPGAMLSGATGGRRCTRTACAAECGRMMTGRAPHIFPSSSQRRRARPGGARSQKFST